MLDFLTSDLYGTPKQGVDGNILMEFVLMERLWADSSGQDSYDPYTCAVRSALFLECLDIAGARTLGNSLADSVAYNMSGSSGDLSKNFYAVLALEGLLNMTSPAVTTHFGGDATCNGKNVGDGAVNAYDVAVLMWYQFKFEPYEQLSTDPWTVVTVSGRDDTGARCSLGETRRMWQLAVGEDYCHSGKTAYELGYASQRRLDQAMVPQNSILTANLYKAYTDEPASYQVHEDHYESSAAFANAAPDAVETRLPTARRADVNRKDMLRNVNSMRTLDIDVAEWGVVAGYGRWIRVRAPGVQVALEMYLTGISVDNPVHLSLQAVPPKNCTTCIPVDENSGNVVVAFARRTEYEDEYANAVSVYEESICANIVPALMQSSVMIGNTIALRQQPPSRACGFDVFLWVPENPRSGIHVAKKTNPFSYSARRLAAVGAESPLTDTNTGCHKDIGVLSGSSAMDGFRGLIQRFTSCARYGFTQSETIKPAVTALVPVQQCVAMSCNAHAPARSQVVSRSFHIFASSGLETAYTDSLQMLTMTPRGTGQALSTYTTVYSAYLAFESMLARESHGNECCSGYVCTTTLEGNGTSASVCQVQPLHVAPLSSSPPPPIAEGVEGVEGVEFGVVVAGNVSSFNATSFKMHVSATSGVPASCIELTIQAAGALKVIAIIRPEYNSSVNAVEVKTNLENALNNNKTAASAVLGVEIEEIFTAPKFYVNHYSPPPVSPPPVSPTPKSPPQTPGEEDNVGLILGLSLGGAALLVVITGIVIWNSIDKAQAPPEKEGLREGALVGTSVSSYAQHAQGSALLRYAKADEHSIKLANAFATSVQHSSSKTLKVVDKVSGKARQQKKVQRHDAGSVPFLGMA